MQNHPNNTTRETPAHSVTRHFFIDNPPAASIISLT